MTEPPAARGSDEEYCSRWPDDGHAYSYIKPAGTGLSVKICWGCRHVSGPDLEQQFIDQTISMVQKALPCLREPDQCPKKLDPGVSVWADCACYRNGISFPGALLHTLFGIGELPKYSGRTADQPRVMMAGATDPELVDYAWSILAMVDWTQQTAEWRDMATAWRDRFYGRTDDPPPLAAEPLAGSTPHVDTPHPEEGQGNATAG